jgi:hypothetical protein
MAAYLPAVVLGVLLTAIVAVLVGVSLFVEGPTPSPPGDVGVAVTPAQLGTSPVPKLASH